MEAQSEDDTSSSWNPSANWKISHGSLHSSITVESSDSPVHSATVDPTSKSPLLLISPSSDSAPCEIKISFKQKHEIQQVYIRSTARVYEIYYAPDLRSNNEYLCTVRCGIAVRDEEVLHTSDIEDTVGTESKEKSKEVDLTEEKYTSGSNNGSSEDDWVEVKFPNSPVLDNKKSSLPKKPCAGKSSIQDFYEATAEISDSDPCISLTLRLLSLQNKERVIIDEIYIFADPVDDLSNSEDQSTLQAGNPSGSSLMAMLAPTLFQLSKSGIGRLQENQPTTNKEQEYQEIGSKKAELNNTPTRIPNEEKPNEQDVKLNSNEQDEGARKYDFAAKNDDLYNRFEGILERLETRVSRIEDMFLRFEESMVKPINGIETRLQRVEQQLEALSGSFQKLPMFPSCTRFSAPAFSSMEDSYSSSYNEGTDLPREPEPEKDSPANDSPVVKPPAFSFIESYSSAYNEGMDLPQEPEPEKDSPAGKPPVFSSMESYSSSYNEGTNLPREPEPEKDSPPAKPKKSVSIDDALAAAFAGFSSLATVQPPKLNDILERNGDDEMDSYSVSATGPSKYKQTLKVTAPEFSMEENENDDKVLKVTAPEFNIEENENDDKVSSPSIDETDVSDSCVENPLFEEACEGCTDCSSVGTGKQNFKEDDQRIIEELVPKRDAFVVDFETPILDVAFVSRENSSSSFPLEALLGDAEGGVEVEESDSLTIVDDGGTDESLLLVDLEGYDVGEVEAEDDEVRGSNTEEVFESLI